MLQSLRLRNFVNACDISIQWDSGLCILTGKTGVGKSILVSALSLLAGARAEDRHFAKGESSAEISATFDISAPVLDWLRQNGLDDEQHCILRRQLQRGKGSKNWINDRPVTLKNMHELGERLISIYGQHQHQRLLKRDQQRQLVDELGALKSPLQKLNALYEEDQALQQTIAQSAQQSYAPEDLADLRFQIQELEAVAESLGRYQQLNQRLEQLEHSKELGQGLSTHLESLYESESHSVLSRLELACRELAQLQKWCEALQEPIALLTEASTMINEAQHGLRKALDDLPQDDQEYRHIDEQMGNIAKLTRKHRCKAHELMDKMEALRAKMDHMQNHDQHVQALKEQRSKLLQRYHALAANIRAVREETIARLNADVSAELASLGMEKARLCVVLKPNRDSQPTRYGSEQVEFLIVTHAGADPLPLADIASGGELSRIGLAIQLKTHAVSSVATLVFDEVDSGIGGKIAHNVGESLARVGAHTQVLCITHLPQVAAHGRWHYSIRRHEAGATAIAVIKLDHEARIEELSQMLEGTRITENTRDLARELLQQSQRT